MMLKNYFEEKKGIEILAATDSSGKVDVAIYSRPHILADGSIAVIMRDWPTRCNLQSNPPMADFCSWRKDAAMGEAALSKKGSEEQNPELIKKIKRRKYTDENLDPKFLFYFQLGKDLPL